MHKFKHDCLPSVFNCLFTKLDNIHSCNTRQKTSQEYIVFRVCLFPKQKWMNEYLYSCSPHPLYIGMLFPTVFCCFYAYFTWRWFDAFYFITTCKTSSIKIWFVLAAGLAENLTQVVFRQPFVIQHVRTRLLSCEIS